MQKNPEVHSPSEKLPWSGSDRLTTANSDTASDAKVPLRAFRAIAISVLACHGLALYLLSLQVSNVSLKPQNKPLIVQTIQLKPVQLQETVVASAPTAKPPKAKQSISPPAAPPHPPSSNTKPKPAPKPAPAIKTQPIKTSPSEGKTKPHIDEKKKKLLQLAKENLAKIGQRSDKIGANSVTTTELGKGKIEKISSLKTLQASPERSNDKQQLSQQLRSFLKLPEYGDVEIKLSLNKTGTVTELKIIRSASERNKKYIQELIPKLKFSCVGMNFSNNSIMSFNITLTNE